LKREGGVDQVKICVTDSKALAARVERRFDPFGPMIGIPELCRDEDILAGDCSRGELGLQGLAYLTLIPIAFRAIKVTKSNP
jgi:hypothetical protein